MAENIQSKRRRPPGEVIQIFEDGRIVINLGSDSGVNEDTRLVVVRTYDEMTDPATGDSLGRIMNPKVDLDIHSVDEKFCVTYARRNLSDTIARMNPFSKSDRSVEARIGDEVVFADDWDV